MTYAEPVMRPLLELELFLLVYVLPERMVFVAQEALAMQLQELLFFGFVILNLGLVHRVDWVEDRKWGLVTLLMGICTRNRVVMCVCPLEIVLFGHFTPVFRASVFAGSALEICHRHGLSTRLHVGLHALNVAFFALFATSESEVVRNFALLAAVILAWWVTERQIDNPCATLVIVCIIGDVVWRRFSEYFGFVTFFSIVALLLHPFMVGVFGPQWLRVVLMHVLRKVGLERKGTEELILDSGTHLALEPTRAAVAGKECVICYGEIEEGDIVPVLPCKHKLHVDCGAEWFKRRPQCPMCLRWL
jgi:hypothetical protein